MKHFLNWLTNFLPCRVISDVDTPYLERYYLFTLFGAHFYLHQFVGSDPDCGLHDHPWRWAVSFILVGCYIEDTRYGLREVRWFNKLTGDSFHRVILPTLGSSVWTLFFHRAKREKTWGFLHPSGEIDLLFKQHQYRLDELGRDEKWWKTAPTGRQVRAARKN